MCPLQLTIDVWNATTPKKSQIPECTYTKASPPLIDHRSMEYHYTKYI